MNADNDQVKGDNEEKEGREMIKIMRKERKQIKKEVKREERQKDEERKKLELKFGPRDNRVRIISRELASKLIDSQKPQTHPQQLQLTPGDFPSLDEIAYRSENLNFTDDISCNNFENRVTNKQRTSSRITDLNVSRANKNTSKPTETESIKFTEDVNFNDFENIRDPNDVNLSALGELNITKQNEEITINTGNNTKKRRRRNRGRESRKNRKRKPYTKLLQSKELNLSEPEALNLSVLDELNLSQLEELSLPEPEELNGSKPKALTISEPKEIKLSEPNPLNVSARQQLNLSEPEELNAAKPKALTLSEPKEMKLSGANALNVSARQELNLSEPVELNLPALKELNPPGPVEINLTNPNEQNIKKIKRVNFGPVQVNILDVLQKPKKKRKKVKVREKSNKQYEGNTLDASQPERKRGKQREIPKPKKPSKLKQLIRRDIEQLNAEEMNHIPRYTQFHLDYSKNVIMEELDNAVTAFLSNIVRFQENMYERDPIKACAKKRYMVGFRIVRKFLLLKQVKILIVAPDIKAKHRGDTLDTTVEDIVSLAAVSEIPYVFALCRRKLGRMTMKPVPVSCVAILNCDGAEKELDKVLELLKIAREDYQKTKPKPVDPQKELTQEIIDNFLSFI